MKCLISYEYYLKEKEMSQKLRLYNPNTTIITRTISLSTINSLKNYEISLQSVSKTTIKSLIVSKGTN